MADDRRRSAGGLAYSQAVTFTVVGLLLLLGVIEFGVCAFMLTLTRNKNSEFGKLLSGFDRFGDACLTGILKYVYTFLWGLLFVIPGYVKNYSYSMTMYIMQDHPELSGNEAITKSREMMNGHKFDLFVLDLTFLGWYILGAMTFGILLIFYVLALSSGDTSQLLRAASHGQRGLDRARQP